MTVHANAMVLWLLLGGATFSSLVGITGVSNFLSKSLAAMPVSPSVTLAIMLGVLLVLGMFIENASIIMICAPIFFPVANELGFDPLWFGLLFLMCIIIGMITPPFGYNLFFMKGLGFQEITMGDIYGSIIPYCWLMIGVLVLCVLFPQIALWLPNQMIR
jgi:TRAP-type C4-dicarboxylate transport system permease large subunit